MNKYYKQNLQALKGYPGLPLGCSPIDFDEDYHMCFEPYNEICAICEETFLADEPYLEECRYCR